MPERGIRVPIPSPEWDAEAEIARRARRLTSEINQLAFDDAARVRSLFSELIGRPVDETFTLIPPFYCSGGREIRIGRKVFINQGCTIYDMGGVTIGDLVMIGPNVNIITSSHPVEPGLRRQGVEGRPIVLARNVWIAAAVTIIGGVTIGENSVIGAGSVVTRDVPPNRFAAGVPARVIRKIGNHPSRPRAAASSIPK